MRTLATKALLFCATPGDKPDQVAELLASHGFRVDRRPRGQRYDLVVTDKPVRVTGRHLVSVGDVKGRRDRRSHQARDWETALVDLRDLLTRWEFDLAEAPADSPTPWLDAEADETFVAELEKQAETDESKRPALRAARVLRRLDG